MNTPKVPGRVLAWTALLVALGASVLANMAYARPALGPRLSAGTAPLLVVLGAGLLERVPLTTARWWQRWLAVGGLVFVVATAFVASYQHQRALLLAYGNPDLSAVLLPFAVDALIIMSSVCLAVIAERRRALAASTPADAPDGNAETAARGVPHAAAVDLPERVTSGVTSDASAKRAGRPNTTARKVARAHARYPDASHAELAKRAGVSVSSVSRYRPVKPDGAESVTGPVTEPVNGNAPNPAPDTTPLPVPAGT